MFSVNCANKYFTKIIVNTKLCNGIDQLKDLFLNYWQIPPLSSTRLEAAANLKPPAGTVSLSLSYELELQTIQSSKEWLKKASWKHTAVMTCWRLSIGKYGITSCPQSVVHSAWLAVQLLSYSDGVSPRVNLYHTSHESQTVNVHLTGTLVLNSSELRNKKN